MFSMPRGERGPTPGGPITRWHTHRVCIARRRSGASTPLPDGSCPRGATARQGSEMMHVWFTKDLRSAFAIHAPLRELGLAGPHSRGVLQAGHESRGRSRDSGVVILSRMLRAVFCGVVVATVLATAAAGQLVQQSAKLTGAGEVGQGRFGVSVALSADGNTALVGGNTDNNTFTFGVGAAWVFTRTGSSWAPQGPKLTASDGVNLPAFGYDVALSADGNTALIGGPGDTGTSAPCWTFTRSGGVWTQQGPKLTAAGEVGAGRFGETVALSADGTTAVVGAPNEGDGTLRVYTRSTGAWVPAGPGARRQRRPRVRLSRREPRAFGRREHDSSPPARTRTQRPAPPGSSHARVGRGASRGRS